MSPQASSAGRLKRHRLIAMLGCITGASLTVDGGTNA
jgi:hypothetical protein